MKKTRIAVYISDVGFGHMIRQREIIKYLLLKFKNSEITIVNALQLEILRETFKDKVKYLKRFNNIELFKSKEVFLTSASSFVTPIIEIDNIKINNGIIGKTSIELRNLYFQNF